MDANRTMGRGKRQSESQTRDRLQSSMREAGLSSHTQRVYLREFDRFTDGLDRKTCLRATCADARRYLSGLKVAGVSATRYGNASAVLRLFFERVRALVWKPVSALQQRMIEDMQLHGFAAKTQKSYVRAVRGLVRYYKRSPEQIDDEQIRRYFVHLTSERKLARATVTIALCGIKFFYEKTLKRDWSLTGVTYHLVTFTVHGQLRRMIRAHPRDGLEWLMRNAADTLMDICRNPRWIGGSPGMSAVLHTWTRQLEYHPHVHFIVSGGGIDGGGQWHEADPKFLVPVHALSNVFRARMRDALKTQQPERFAQVAERVWRDDDWVVHSKPVGSGQKAYEYLARYVYRVALGEHAILRHTHETITIRYRTSDTNQPRTLRLEPSEFMRRFLQHVLPSRFCKVRHYGLHHSSKRPLLKRIQAALAILHKEPLPAPAAESEPAAPQCPDCQTPMRFDRRLTPSQWSQGFGILPPHHQRAPP